MGGHKLLSIMFLLNKHINDLNEVDIGRLIENGIIESKILDYKREIKVGNDEEKKEFLADITAMANTEGGVIIYGIEERKDEAGQNTGIAGIIVGIEAFNKDKLMQQIEDTIRSNTDPKLNNVVIRFMELDGKDILIIGLRKFVALPHMVIFKSSNRFYKRRNTGKYLVDTHELNDLFMNNFLLKERANRFVKERIDIVRNGGYIPTLDLGGSFFLHIIPIGHMGDNIIDLTILKNTEFLQLKMIPMHSSGWNHVFNLDGFSTYNTIDKQVYTYSQLFRDGSLEFYTSHFHKKIEKAEIYKIYGPHIEELVFRSINIAFEIYKEFSIEPPYAVFTNMFDTAKGVLTVDHRMISFINNLIARNSIHLPSVVLNSTEVDLWAALKPVFDILWQAGGFPKSPYYKDDGTRRYLNTTY